MFYNIFLILFLSRISVSNTEHFIGTDNVIHLFKAKHAIKDSRGRTIAPKHGKIVRRGPAQDPAMSHPGK